MISTDTQSVNIDLFSDRPVFQVIRINDLIPWDNSVLVLFLFRRRSALVLNWFNYNDSMLFEKNKFEPQFVCLFVWWAGSREVDQQKDRSILNMEHSFRLLKNCVISRSNQDQISLHTLDSSH